MPRHLAVLLALPVLLAACGGAEVASDAVPSQTQQLFLVRPVGSAGPLVGYSMPSARERFSLPAGLASADGNGFFSASQRGGRTRVEVFDPSDGSLRRSFGVSGSWKLAGVAPTGRWLALAARRGDETRVRVVDARTGVARPPLVLAGDFEVETISADGASLFLVEHLADGAYRIRLYDLARARLVDGILKAKGSDEVMAGFAWNGVASPNGNWLLTLYLSTARDVAFVHALNLAARTPFCIDLPSATSDFEELKAYALALAPDGKTLYAVNPALGVVATVSLPSLRVVDVAGFDAFAGAGPQTQTALSPDGRNLYFSNGKVVWAYDTAGRAVERVYASETPLEGLGVDRGGKALYLAPAARAPLELRL
jgi:hypothetical protein